MPLSKAAKEYCEALFDNRQADLLRDLEKKREHLRGGLIAREEAERRMGPYAYTDAEIDFLMVIAECRKECLSAAFDLQGDSLTDAIIDEIMLDIGFLIEGRSVVFLGNERDAYEDIVRRTGGIDVPVEVRLVEISRRMVQPAYDTKRRIKNELIVAMHESARLSRSGRMATSEATRLETGEELPFSTNAHSSTASARTPGDSYEVFVSHATEDKPYVEPLVEALHGAGIRVWYDRVVLEWGDDLRMAIDRGLRSCRYGIVVFSKAFLNKKKWTEYELNSLFAREEAGRKVILPIWHGVSRGDLLEYGPAFADRLAVISSGDTYSDIVAKLLAMLGRAPSSATASPPLQGADPNKQTGRPQNAIAHARYETTGESAVRAEAYVRPSDQQDGWYLFESSFGERLHGTKEQVALRFTAFDSELRMKGYTRMAYGNASGDRAFDL